MPGRALRIDERAPYRALVGVGGIGSGIVFALDGDHALGRNESRPGRLLEARDYCKLHIIAHYPAVLLGARPDGSGFRVLPIAKVGSDEAGRRLTQEMTEAGMETRFVEALPGRPTLFSVCFQYPDGSGGNITISDSAASCLTSADVDRVAPLLGAHTIALAAPEAPLEARLHLLALATSRGAYRVASFTSAEIPCARQRGALAHVDLLAVNEDEAAALAGAPFPEGDPIPFLDRCAAALAQENPLARLVVSAGARGAYAWSGGRWEHARPLPVRVESTAGAGDALLGGVLTGLAVGLPLMASGAHAERSVASALDLGVCLAAFKCTSPHTIPPETSLDSLLAFAAAQGLTFSQELLGHAT